MLGLEVLSRVGRRIIKDYDLVDAEDGCAASDAGREGGFEVMSLSAAYILPSTLTLNA